MKTIVYRGGVVTFRIPSHWREEYSDTEGGTFFDDSAGTGTLRLKVTTLKSEGQLRPNAAMELLQVVADRAKLEGVGGKMKVRKDGNAVFKYVDTACEDGVWGTIYYWVVANPLPPRHARVANFSYAVPVAKRRHEQVRRYLAMLEVEIEAASFSPQLGISPE